MKLKAPKYRRLVFDAETDGLLDQVTVCHCVCVRDYDTGQRWTFRHNKREDTIHKLFSLLDDAEELWGHNIVAYDIPMLEYLYDWTPKSRIRDTLVLARLYFPDSKDKDFRLHEAGKLDGKLIGKHTLDSWGQRLGMFKGDYKKIKEEQGLARGLTKDSDAMRLWVWGTWTAELEEYCMNDVEVTSLLVNMIEQRHTDAAKDAVYVQHRLADLMARQQDNGFMFDVVRGQQLADDLTVAKGKLEATLDIEFPGRFIPAKRMSEQPKGRCVSGGEYPEFGMEPESDRRWYGQPEQRKRASPKWKDPYAAQWEEGAWYTPLKWQEFNPRSRPQITDRLQEMGWDPEPEDYTEKGNVKANDVILRRIIERFPVAEHLADLMAVNKLMGQLLDGSQAWLKVVDANGFIHGYVNPCGAVTTRATHAFPNLAQVPAVRKKKAKVKDLKRYTGVQGIVGANAEWRGGPVLVVDKHGKKLSWQELDATDEHGRDTEVTCIILGLKGGWGYECRSLFGVPDGWVLVGSDLAGIELRCLAHEMAKYDGGAYGKVLLEGDVHSENQRLAELETRDTAKTFIYAFLYGAGDEKIGKIVSPLSPPHVQGQIGKALKAKFLRNLPALSKVIREIQRQASRKYLTGLDGRRLFVRSKHAALNTALQGMGATIANWWLIMVEDMMAEAGFEYGWNKDWVQACWIHDEIQLVVREGMQEQVADICKNAANAAGKFLKFLLPVEASAVWGYRWSETH